MKKGLKITFVILAALFLGYYAYTRYQNIQSLKGVVHKDAMSVIKVGIHSIKERLALDALSAPQYYYDNLEFSDSSDDDTEEETPGNGITLMPNNLLLFTMPELDNTLFTVLNIYNPTEFNQFIREELKDKADTIKKDETGAYETSFFKNKNTVLAWNEDKLVVALSSKINSTGITSVFKDILIANKTISDTDHHLLKAVKKQSSHVVYADANGISTLDFKDEKAVLNGNITSTTSYNSQIIAPKYTNASFSLHYNAPINNFNKQQLKKQLQSISFFEKNNLNIEKIVEPLDGNFSLAIAGRVTQNDTIVTYEYNDNFEKVAQKSLEEKEVPGIYLGLGIKKEGLKNHFSETGALSTNGIFEPFPLYQLQVEESPSQINFSTDHNTKTIKNKESSYFFNLITDFSKLQQDLDIPQTKKLFHILDSMQLHAWQEEENKIQLQGFISGFNTDVNILSQVFFGLNQQQTEETEL